MSKFGVFFVTDELQRALDNLPADEPRSRLEPFRGFILKWRREGRSYRRIQAILRDECKVTVTYETLRQFVKRRVRPRKAHPEMLGVTAPIAMPVGPAVTQRSPSRRSPEEIAAMRQAASAANHKPVFQPAGESKPLFVFDPGRPLTNKPIREEK
jgi:hypothetical protein